MAIKVQDHLGNKFKSIREMALFHGKDPTKVTINLNSQPLQHIKNSIK